MTTPAFPLCSIPEVPPSERVHRALGRAATVAAAVVALAGVAGLLSVGGLDLGVDVPLGAALAFVLAGSGLFAIVQGWNVAARALSLGTIFVAAASASRLLAPSGSVALELLAFAIFVSTLDRSARARSTFAAGAALLAMMLGALAVGVHVNGIPRLYGWGLYVRMAPYTAAVMCALGAGVLVAAIRGGAAAGRPLRRWLPALVTVGMTGATLVMWQAIVEHDRRGVESVVRQQAAAMAGELVRHNLDLARLLDRVTDRWANDPARNLARWALTTRNWERDYPGMKGLGWADSSTTLRWSEPAAGVAFISNGMRLDRDERSAGTVRRAGERNGTQVSEPVGVGTGQVRLLLVSPVHGRGRVTGYLASSLDVGRYIHDVYGEDVARGYAFAIHDGTSLLFERRRTDAAPVERWQVAVPVSAIGRRWVLTVTPTQGSLAAASSIVPTAFLVGGLLAAALLGWIVFVAQRSRELTTQLAGLVHRLADENVARREAEQMRAALVHSTLDGIAAFDASGCVSAWNPRMASLTGRAESEVDGQMIGDMVPFLPEGTEVHMLLDALAGRRTQVADVRTTHSSTGQDIWLDVTVTPMRSEDGRALGGLLVARDVTERKQLVDVVLAGKLAAEEANRAKSDFLARMSHELRTPLNAVIGFTNVLRRNRRGRLEPDELTYLDRINANGRHLLGMINEILDLAKIESGREEVELMPTSIATLVRDTVADLDVRASGASVRLDSQVPAEVLEMYADEAKLKQVLINLIGNAIKFTPPTGRVTVTVATDVAAGRPIRIDVIDTGIGIPASRLGAIFEAFEQVDSDTARRFGGTGLGLAISRQLCLLMGYELVVQSEVGVGSTFSIILPERRQGQAAA